MSAPIQGNGTTDGSPVVLGVMGPDTQDVQPEAVRCARCGAEWPSGTQRCGACKSFLAANEAARTHGLFARRLPDDLKTSVDEWRADVIASQGGLTELEGEPLRAGLIRSLVHAETGERLLMNAIIKAGGVDGRAGQRLYDSLLATIDRKLRLSLALGIARRQKAVPSPAEYWRAKQSGAADA